MHSYEQLAPQASNFVTAYTKYADSFLAYAVTVHNMRKDPTYSGVKRGRIAGTALGIAILAPSVALDGLQSVRERQRFRNIHRDWFPTTELDNTELFNAAVAIVDDKIYPSLETCDLESPNIQSTQK